MSQSPLENVVAHWSKLIENFETSPKDFYTSVEAALDRRQIPSLKTSRVDWFEGGILWPQREYLRVAGERHCFDMCAAPFGTGFFFSSWTTKKKARFVLLYLIGVGIITLFVWRALQAILAPLWSMMPGLMGPLFQLGIGNPFVLIPLSFLIVLWLVGLAARGGHYGPEGAILTVPLIGWFYARVFSPETYYRIDSTLMFQSAAHAAMLEVIDGLTTEKGVRGLTEDDRKPIFHALA